MATANDVQVAIARDMFAIDIRLFTGDNIGEDIYTVGDNGETYLPIKTEAWSDFTITNDMFTLLPNLRMEVIDMGIKNVTTYNGDGNSFIRIKMYDQNKKIEIDETFVIDDIRLVTCTADTANYTIIASSVRKIWFGQSISYATGYDSPLPVSEIIENVLEVAKIDFYENDKDFVVTNAKIPYISPANSNVYDNLGYLFQRILIDDTSDGIYTLPYDMIKQKLIYTKINSKIQNYKDNVKIHNNLSLSTKERAKNNKEMQILDPETIHVIGGSTLSYDMSSDVDIHEFNHKTREWTINPKSYDTITKLLPQLITDYDDGSSEQTIMKTLQPYFTKQGLIYKNDTHTWYDLDYAEHIQKLFKLTNSIYFKTQGHLDRMPTDLINIQTTDHNIAVSSQFSGIWMIAKISTRVTKNEFYQDVDLVRVNKKIFVPREG